MQGGQGRATIRAMASSQDSASSAPAASAATSAAGSPRPARGAPSSAASASPQEIRAHGLHLTDYRGADLRVPAAQVHFDTDPGALRHGGPRAGHGEVGRHRRRPGARSLACSSPARSSSASRTGCTTRRCCGTQLPRPHGAHRHGAVQRRRAGQGAFHRAPRARSRCEQHAALAPFLDAFARAGLP